MAEVVPAGSKFYVLFQQLKFPLKLLKCEFLAWKSNSARMTEELPVTRGQLEKERI